MNKLAIFTYIATTLASVGGLNLSLPGNDYIMIDDQHIDELRKGGSVGYWGQVDVSKINIRDVHRWGITPAALQAHIIMLNFERMEDWHLCEAAMKEIVRQIKEINPECIICLYSHNHQGYATGIVDSICRPANYLGGTNPNRAWYKDEIPVLHPNEHGLDNTERALNVLKQIPNIASVMIWATVRWARYDLEKKKNEYIRMLADLPIEV